jgi:micrococcal nuclease
MSTMLTLALVLVLALSAFAYDDIIGVQYVRCHDGDTCTINIAHLPDVFGHEIPLRLRGIDAPEISGKCLKEKQHAQRAKGYLNGLLASGKAIGLSQIQRDKYFRLLAVVHVDGVNVNQLLLDRGYARAYDGKTKQSWC